MGRRNNMCKGPEAGRELPSPGTQKRIMTMMFDGRAIVSLGLQAQNSPWHIVNVNRYLPSE